MPLNQDTQQELSRRCIRLINTQRQLDGYVEATPGSALSQLERKLISVVSQLTDLMTDLLDAVCDDEEP